MRDHMNPPRVVSTSCFIPQTKHGSHSTVVSTLLPIFRGCEEDNPYTHIKKIEEICSTF